MTKLFSHNITVYPSFGEFTKPQNPYKPFSFKIVLYKSISLLFILIIQQFSRHNNLFYCYRSPPFQWIVKHKQNLQLLTLTLRLMTNTCTWKLISPAEKDKYSLCGRRHHPLITRNHNSLLMSIFYFISKHKSSE